MDKKQQQQLLQKQIEWFCKVIRQGWQEQQQDYDKEQFINEYIKNFKMKRDKKYEKQRSTNNTSNRTR